MVIALSTIFFVVGIETKFFNFHSKFLVAASNNFFQTSIYASAHMNALIRAYIPANSFLRIYTTLFMKQIRRINNGWLHGPGFDCCEMHPTKSWLRATLYLCMIKKNFSANVEINYAKHIFLNLFTVREGYIAD